MKMRNILYGLCCLSAVVVMTVSCRKHTYDFSYSPSNPKVGQKVTFTNQSDAGESWAWRFGDGSVSILRNPTHIYSTPGSYAVELMVDSNKSRKVSHVLEILDSIPSIYLEKDTIPQYTLFTIKASLYNPTNATVTYNWSVDEDIFVIAFGSLTSDSIMGYYTDFGMQTDVGLVVTVGEKVTTDRRTITLIDHPAPELYMQTLDGVVWRQRIYEGMYERARRYRGDEHVIDAANDSTAVLNGVTYDIHNMPVLKDKDVLALQVDVINRKLYVILDDGLYVANANGEYLTQITDATTLTLIVDAERNSLYWSTEEGVWAMPLVTHPQNIISEQQRYKILEVNDVEAVYRMLILEN